MFFVFSSWSLSLNNKNINIIFLQLTDSSALDHFLNIFLAVQMWNINSFISSTLKNYTLVYRIIPKFSKISKIKTHSQKLKKHYTQMKVLCTLISSTSYVCSFVDTVHSVYYSSVGEGLVRVTHIVSGLFMQMRLRFIQFVVHMEHQLARVQVSCEA